MCELTRNTMNNENINPRKHKRYDENFKRSAVELWLEGGKSVQQIAAELLVIAFTASAAESSLY